MTALTADATDERGLVAAAQAGDERAFRALVDPYQRALEVHCYRMLGSPHDAQDIVQETLLRAWRALDRFERRSSVATWLYRIATNACLDELERRPRRPEPVVEPYPDERLHETQSAVVDPAARYALREGMELALLTAIQRLPGRQRAVLILRDVLGWTGVEVAELLDTTVAAVNSALQRARATIERELPVARVAPGRATERELLRRYVDAWERSDMDALVALLREDAVMTMPPGPSLFGAGEIGTFFASNCARRMYAVSPTAANGGPAVIFTHRADDDTTILHRVVCLDVRDGQIAAMHAHGGRRLLALFGERVKPLRRS